MLVARPEYFPEQGTDVEKTAMRFHAVRNHPSFKVPLTGPRTAVAANFVTNGSAVRRSALRSTSPASTTPACA
jgi:hypothetical protein